MSAPCAGIFVDDILDAVPIDKWFEMFKPGAAGEGGFIRVHMSFSENNPSESRDPSPTETLAPTGTILAQELHNLIGLVAAAYTCVSWPLLASEHNMKVQSIARCDVCLDLLCPQLTSFQPQNGCGNNRRYACNSAVSDQMHVLMRYMCF